MDRLRTFAFSIFFYGLSVPIVLFVPVMALFGRQALIDYANGWISLLGWSARHILGIRVEWRGERPAGAALYAGKHESILETLLLAQHLGAPRVVMKRELLKIPIWGWAAKVYGVIPVDREASAAALRAIMREGKAALADGRSVMIFPEGTRVRPGEKPPLKSGLAGLYRALGLPVVPVAVRSGHVWPRQGAKRPGVMTIEFQPPITAGLPRAEIEARVHEGINRFNSTD